MRAESLAQTHLEINAEDSSENDAISRCQKLEDNTKKLTIAEHRETLHKIQMVLKKVDKQILPHKNIYEKMDDFEETTHDREFFYANEKGDSYLQMLFGLPSHIINSKRGRDYIKEKINNKTIMLLGGGDSIKDLLTARKIFHPKEVINIDPYLKSETLEKNKNHIYHSVNESASDPNIINEIVSGELPKADEIWATVSVPFYLNSSEEIKTLFMNISVALKEGGTARIYPVALQANITGEDTYEIRKKAFLEEIDILMLKSDMNIKLMENTDDGHTLIIQKLKKQYLS